MEDEFDSLRKKSARASSVYEEMGEDDESVEEGNFFSRLKPGQRLFLALLLLLNVLAFACLIVALVSSLG